MNIEKVTFYKQATAPNRSNTNSPGHNLVQISLPRLKCLEVDGPYRPEWAVDYTPAPPPEEIVKPEPPKFRAARQPANMRKMPLTHMEKTAFELSQTGLSSTEIAKRLHWTMGGTKDAIYRAKIKLGIYPMKKKESGKLTRQAGDDQCSS